MADDEQSGGEAEPRDEMETTGAGETADGATDPYGTNAAPADPYEGAVPPGYDWPTHGGYLGCLMGLIAACLVSGFVGSFVIGLISVTPLGGLVSTAFARITLLVLAFVVCFGLLGRLGWNLGRRFYREYPQPSPSERSSERVPSGEGHAQPQEHERVL